MRYICFGHSKNQPQTAYQFVVADATYQSSAALSELTSFETHQTTSDIQCAQMGVNSAQMRLCFNDTVSIGDQAYSLVVHNGSTGYRLEHNTHHYHITSEYILAPPDDFDPVLFFGPVMMINLALNGVYCLHASAFTIKQRTFILMAPSGTGKSTIAHFVDQQKNSKRIADDILPIKIIDDHLTVLPQFPQLKLDDEQQYKGSAIHVEPVLLFAEKNDQHTRLKPMTPFEAMKKLVSHTVASALFNTNQLDAHLKLCHQAGQQCKSYHLHYQHGPSSLTQLYEALHEMC